MPYMPPFVAPARFTDAAAALDQVKAIYQGGLAHLRESMLRFVDGDELPGRVRACYPFVRVHTHTVARHTPPANAGLSYGFVAGPGRYETTLTRPDLYARYYLDQFRLLLENHQVELEVGTSTQPIPIHFSFAENDHIEGTMSPERRALMRDVFDLPDLGAMDDGIANGTFEALRAGGVVAGFCGHDHTNDFCVEHRGVQLCYEGSPGFGGYGYCLLGICVNRRARVTELKLEADGGDGGGPRLGSVRSWKRVDGGGAVAGKTVDDEELWARRPEGAAPPEQLANAGRRKPASAEEVARLPQRKQPRGLTTSGPRAHLASWDWPPSTAAFW